MTRPGIFCLEGEWTADLTKRRSVEPLLELLKGLGECGDYIHRDVAGRGDLEFYLDKWLLKKYERFPVGYLAFHGEQSAIGLGRDVVTLDELADILRGRAQGRVLYFGSCSTLRVPDEDLVEFCKATGLKAVIGYKSDIDWIQSAAFDIVLLSEVLNRPQMKPMYARLRRQYAGLVEDLGLRMATTTWCEG